MGKKMTHTGYIVGVDNRTPPNTRTKIALRETKLYWVSLFDVKYHKRNGRLAGGDWPMYRLDIESIMED